MIENVDLQTYVVIKIESILAAKSLKFTYFKFLQQEIISDSLEQIKMLQTIIPKIHFIVQKEKI